jgi:hypothetical protein
MSNPTTSHLTLLDTDRRPKFSCPSQHLKVAGLNLDGDRALHGLE